MPRRGSPVHIGIAAVPPVEAHNRVTKPVAEQHRANGFLSAAMRVPAHS